MEWFPQKILGSLGPFTMAEEWLNRDIIEVYTSGRAGRRWD